MLHTYSLSQLNHALKKKEVSSVELTQYYFERINQAKALNAFISTHAESALEQAKLADARIAKQSLGPLTGIPMAHKDNICTKGILTTCASKMLKDFVSPYDASIVNNLSLQGSVSLGKTNLDEFAMGSSNENSFFGPCLNPWNQSCTPGGSSGGSAAAVAARLVPFATGTDTGGSIRQPAAFCGVSGLKPTYGLVSRYGIVAYASSFDQAGLIAPSAEDLALALSGIAGFDPKDSTSIAVKIPDYTAALQQSIKGKKIGLPECFFHPAVDQAIQTAVLKAIGLLEEAGAIIVNIDLKLSETWIPCYYTLACAEAASNLSRFDGIRFGHQSQSSDGSLTDLVTQSRTEGFGNEVKRRILTGTYLLSANQIDTHYTHAQKVRHLIRNTLQEALSQVDLLLGPTTPSVAYALDGAQTSAIHHQLSDIFTVAANLAGLPGLSIPVGFHQGMPIGMQLLGPHFGETLLLNVAHQYQCMTSWHQQIPPEFASMNQGAPQ